MAAHLSSGRVNLTALREAGRRELREFLDKCAGSKAIVWDEYLTGPFGLIAQYSLLKEHEVEKMFTLKPGRLPPADVKNIIFFVRPKLELMDIITDNVLREDRGRSPQRDFHILFVPRRSLLCEQWLKEQGVLGSFIHREQYSLDLIPFDGDLLSMESESAFKECYLESDQTSLYHAAKGLMTLQALYGTIPQIFGKGDCARHVANMMIRMKHEFPGSQNSIFPVFDTLLLLDRNVDLLTPLATQLTYEGLIDEIYGIQNTYVKLPPEKFAPKKQGEGGKDLPTEPKKLQLNSAEELYAEIRDKNFNAVGSVLSKKAKIISAAFEERHHAKTVGEIKQFVSQLPHMQAARSSLANHTSIAELIKDITTSEDFFDNLTVEQEFMSGIDTDKVNNYIEDCIAQKHPLIKILRLVCLQSVCNSGLKQKVLDHYKREILQTYGYEHILTLNNLEKAGLLKPQTGGRNNYPTIRKTLRLWMDDVNEQNPNDISYVYSGYAPLSVRLAQLLARPGWRSIEEVLKMLPGPHFEERQQLPTGLQKKRQHGENRVTLVFFLGGGHVCGDRCAEISVPDGGWRHRVRHCHYKTDQWNNLDQILDGKTGACPILGWVVRDSQSWRPCATQARRLLVLARLLCRRNTAVKEALLGPAHEPVTLISSALVFQLSVEVPSRQAGLKGTKDKQLRERSLLMA
ncbi:vacuolar protein sorting-associated protein 33A [Corvus kubaryi]|uniref:vacuolar protein sorting-associated protein 33A n=1 Tax=Corvus kubaryi TaxID=68294 RepID=UPI001C0542BF|nr:vacuolar protein sorting-associated protein 33A [Corvus kubaryi]